LVPGFFVVQALLRREILGVWNFISENHGTIAEQDSKLLYYWNANYYTNLPEMWIMRYNITDGTFEMAFEPTLNHDINTKVLDSLWERVAATEIYTHLKIYAKDDLLTFRYQDWWILRGGVPGVYTFFDDPSIAWRNRYFGTNHPEKNKLFTSWFVDSNGFWWIKKYDAQNPSDFASENDERLISEYDGIISAPMIYEEVGAEHHYCGCLIDKNVFAIVPYVYTSQAMATIRIADFTGMNCRQALTKLSEGYLDTIDIHEYDKARIYFRETFLGAGTLDWTKYRFTPKIEYWKNYCDGIIIENSKRNLRHRIGNTDYDAKVLRVDNSFISQGTIEVVAKWYYAFFNAWRRIITVEVPFYVEVELMDKITITLRKTDGTVYETLNTIVYETSFDPSPTKDTTHDMTLKLLEIDGTTIHTPRLIKVPNHKLRVP